MTNPELVPLCGKMSSLGPFYLVSLAVLCICITQVACQTSKDPTSVKLSTPTPTPKANEVGKTINRSALVPSNSESKAIATLKKNNSSPKKDLTKKPSGSTSSTSVASKASNSDKPISKVAGDVKANNKPDDLMTAAGHKKKKYMIVKKKPKHKKIKMEVYKPKMKYKKIKMKVPVKKYKKKKVKGYLVKKHKHHH